MPIGVLSRIPNSLSQGGKCRTNLRGLTPSTPYDFVAPSRSFTVGPALSSISTLGSGGWSETIRKAYYSTDSEQSAAITYPSMISTAVAGTLLFRIYIQEYPSSPPVNQTVFQNGQTGTNGYGVFLNTFDDRSQIIYTLYFGRLQDSSMNWVKINTDSTTLNPNEWNQFSLMFNSGDGKSVVRVFQNGAFVKQGNFSEITTPSSGTTQIMNFFGRITDFALIEKEFTDTQLAAYGTAPYI